MPKRSDIKKVMVIGSGPIVIGQAAEFDYAGTQVTARVDPRTTARGGDTVKFALDMEKAHFFDKDTELTIAN